MGVYYELCRMVFWNNYYLKILNLIKLELFMKYSGDDVKFMDNLRNYIGEDVRFMDNLRNYIICLNIGVKLFLNIGFFGFFLFVFFVLLDVFI